MADNTKHVNKIPGITIVDDLPDYSNEPCFIKKKEKMMDFLEKAGLPDGSKFERPKENITK